MLLDIRDYSEPGEYKQAAAEVGIGVSLQFCLATSKIMEKFELTFPDACHFLEEQGFLFWVENAPIYKMSGDVLWVDEEQQRVDEAILDSLNDDAPKSIFNPRKEVHCKFFTLIIQNEALEVKYKGGLKAFIDKYLCEYNNDLTTMTAMASYDLDETINDIEESGLTYGDEFIMLDAFSITDDNSVIELGISWLKAYHLDGGIVVYTSVNIA